MSNISKIISVSRMVHCKISTPIFQMILPKLGTTKLFEFMASNKQQIAFTENK